MDKYWNELFASSSEAASITPEAIKNLKTTYEQTTKENLLFKKALDFLIDNGKVVAQAN
jgi:hypothetical protein